MIFSDDKLRAFYALLKTHNQVVPLRDCADAPCVIMRHDVDYDVTAAMRLADVEEAMGVRSSYFFLTTGPTYNVTAPVNRAHLRALHARGFEVGLHFDPLVYDEADDADDETLAPSAQREVEILSSIIGAPVQSISIHNPSAHGRYPSFDGFNNAYDPRFYARDRYLSDSCMGFRDKDPFEMFSAPVTEVTQVLLHPLHYGPRETTYPEIFRDLVRQYADTLDAYALANPTYARQRRAPLWQEIATPGPTPGALT